MATGHFLVDRREVEEAYGSWLNLKEYERVIIAIASCKGLSDKTNVLVFTERRIVWLFPQSRSSKYISYDKVGLIWGNGTSPSRIITLELRGQNDLSIAVAENGKEVARKIRSTIAEYRAAMGQHPRSGRR